MSTSLFNHSKLAAINNCDFATDSIAVIKRQKPVSCGKVKKKMHCTKHGIPRGGDVPSVFAVAYRLKI